MKQFIPNRELDELGTGVVLTYLKKSGTAGLPRCVDIEGIANSMGLNVVYETFAEDDFDKIGFLSDGITPLKIKRGNRTVPFLFPLGTIVVEADLRKESVYVKCRKCKFEGPLSPAYFRRMKRAHAYTGPCKKRGMRKR